MANSNGSGAKAFGGIMTVAAVIAAMAAIMRPQAQRISMLERQLEAVKGDRWTADDHDRVTNPGLARHDAKLLELENRLRKLEVAP